MKKSITLLSGLIALAATTLSCQKNEAINGANQMGSEGKKVTITACIPEGMTKVSFTPNGDILELNWDQNNDKLTINGEEFRITAIDGQKATFTGNEPSGNSYTIVLNQIGSASLNTQEQSEDGNADHVKYSVALSDVDSYQNIEFSEKWAGDHHGSIELSSALRILAQLPSGVAQKVTGVNIKALDAKGEPANVFAGGNSIAVTLKKAPESGNKVNIYATLPAGTVSIPAKTQFFVKFVTPGAAQDYYTRYHEFTSASSFDPGKVNTLTLQCKNTASYAGKDDNGTEQKPYLIADKYQMVAMGNLLSTTSRIYFKMVDDVDLNGEKWEPVSKDGSTQIDFDGNAHTVSSLNIDNSEDIYPYTGFIGYLYGNIHDVTFSGANVNGGTKISGIVIGRSDASSHAANFKNITVRNATLTANNSYVGGLAGYIKKSEYITNCNIANSSITSTAGNVDPSIVGGLVGELVPNGSCTISNSSVEAVTVVGGCTNENRSGLGGLVGRISAGTVTLMQCYSTGTLTKASTNNVGGLVGYISAGTNIAVQNSYSTCTISRGYTNVGGLMGRVGNVQVSIDNCFSTCNMPWKGGYGGKGGLIGIIQGPSVSVKNSIAWNDQLSGGHEETDTGCGAIVGHTHPNCILTDNYRKPGMAYTGLFWVPSANFDHANVNGSTTPLKRITVDKNENNLIDGTVTDFTDASCKHLFSYHGKHVAAGTTLSTLASTTLGWSTDVWDFSGDLPKLINNPEN